MPDASKLKLAENSTVHNIVTVQFGHWEKVFELKVGDLLHKVLRKVDTEIVNCNTSGKTDKGVFPVFFHQGQPS